MSFKHLKLLQIINKSNNAQSFKRTFVLSQQSSVQLAGLNGEPNEPVIQTKIPGPKSVQMIKELSKLQVCF
jgi:hypothetical protein